jgi:hypothetical protein
MAVGGLRPRFQPSAEVSASTWASRATTPRFRALPARLGESVHDRHEGSPPCRRHAVEDGGDGVAAQADHPVDEALPLGGQCEDEVAPVGGVVTAVEQARRHEPVGLATMTSTRS